MFNRPCLVVSTVASLPEDIASFSNYQTLVLQLLLPNPVKDSLRKAVSECSLLKLLVNRFVPWHYIQLPCQDVAGDVLEIDLTRSQGSLSVCSRAYSEEHVPDTRRKLRNGPSVRYTEEPKMP